MLHEPEFESPETPGEEQTPAQSNRLGKTLRGVLYLGLLGLVGVAVGVQASPKFAAAVGQSVPEPVAAMMASVSGEEKLKSSCEDGCCSSMSRASLMASASTDCVDPIGCCGSDSGSCPFSSGAATAAACSGSSCSGAACAAAEETESDEVATPLSAPGDSAVDESEPVAAELVPAESEAVTPAENTI